jgi:hypothetical protein
MWALARRPVFGHQLQLPAVLLGQVSLGGELVLGEQPGLDPLGEVHLLLGREQAGAADGLEVGVDGIPHSGGLIVQVDLHASRRAGGLTERGLAQRGGLSLGRVQAVEPDDLGDLVRGWRQRSAQSACLPCPFVPRPGFRLALRPGQPRLRPDLSGSPGPARGKGRPPRMRSDARSRQVPALAAELDKLVHARETAQRASRGCVPRHEAPPSWCALPASACRAPPRTARHRWRDSPVHLVLCARALFSNAVQARLFPCRCRTPQVIRPRSGRLAHVAGHPAEPRSAARSGLPTPARTPPPESAPRSACAGSAADPARSAGRSGRMAGSRAPPRP